MVVCVGGVGVVGGVGIVGIVGVVVVVVVVVVVGGSGVYCWGDLVPGAPYGTHTATPDPTHKSMLVHGAMVARG